MNLFQPQQLEKTTPFIGSDNAKGTKHQTHCFVRFHSEARDDQFLSSSLFLGMRKGVGAPLLFQSAHYVLQTLLQKIPQVPEGLCGGTGITQMPVKIQQDVQVITEHLRIGLVIISLFLSIC